MMSFCEVWDDMDQRYLTHYDPLTSILGWSNAGYIFGWTHWRPCSEASPGVKMMTQQNRAEYWGYVCFRYCFFMFLVSLNHIQLAIMRSNARHFACSLVTRLLDHISTYI